MAKIVRNSIDGEVLAGKYIEMYEANLDENGQPTITLSDVATALGMSEANLYQRINGLNKKLEQAGSDFRFPKLKSKPTGRQPRLDINKIAAILARKNAVSAALADLD